MSFFVDSASPPYAACRNELQSTRHRNQVELGACGRPGADSCRDVWRQSRIPCVVICHGSRTRRQLMHTIATAVYRTAQAMSPLFLIFFAIDYAVGKAVFHHSSRSLPPLFGQLVAYTKANDFWMATSFSGPLQSPWGVARQGQFVPQGLFSNHDGLAGREASALLRGTYGMDMLQRAGGYAPVGLNLF